MSPAAGRAAQSEDVDQTLHGIPCLDRRRTEEAHDPVVAEQPQQGQPDVKAQGHNFIVARVRTGRGWRLLRIPLNEHGRRTFVSAMQRTRVPLLGTLKIVSVEALDGLGAHLAERRVGRQLDWRLGETLAGSFGTGHLRLQSSITNWRNVEPLSTASILARVSGRSSVVRMAAKHIFVLPRPNVAARALSELPECGPRFR